MEFLRFCAPVANARGAHVGVFGLVNGLARAGSLSAAEHKWWRASNAWYDAAYVDPATVDPTLFDRTRYPLVSCWFRSTALPLLDRMPGYLGLLDRHGISWVELHSDDPGVIRYADPDQVVVTPY